MHRRRRRRFSWLAAASIGAAAAVMFWQPLASLAKAGAVTTKEGQTYVGDVADADGKLFLTQDGGTKLEFLKSEVASTTYFDNSQQEFDARMRALGPKDVKGRIATARWAMKHKEDGLAAQALDSALKIEPNNIEATTLRKSLMPATPTTPTTPDAANPPKTGTTKPRLVTKDEINRIRQVEWQPSDEGVRVSIDKETKTNFVTRSRDVTPAQFNRMTPPEQGRAILKNGTPEMRQGVHLNSDPAPLLNFRRNIQKTVLTGCAAAGCHDAGSKTSFSLYTDGSDEATYTNYLILQNYKSLFPNDKAKGRVRLMIDRDQPAESLLSEFMLVPKISNTPHPEVQGYSGVYRNAQDPRFKMLTQWIHAMPAVPPNYGIDLSKPPEGDKPAAPAPAPAVPKQ